MKGSRVAAKVAAQVGIPHFYAVCSGCGWTYEDCAERAAGYAAIRKHVRTTGHKVTLEKGVHTTYSLVAAQPAVKARSRKHPGAM